MDLLKEWVLKKYAILEKKMNLCEMKSRNLLKNIKLIKKLSMNYKKDFQKYLKMIAKNL